MEEEAEDAGEAGEPDEDDDDSKAMVELVCCCFLVVVVVSLLPLLLLLLLLLLAVRCCCGSDAYVRLGLFAVCVRVLGSCEVENERVRKKGKKKVFALPFKSLDAIEEGKGEGGKEGRGS